MLFLKSYFSGVSGLFGIGVQISGNQHEAKYKLTMLQVREWHYFNEVLCIFKTSFYGILLTLLLDI